MCQVLLYYITYALFNREDIPVIHIGKRKFIRREKFFEWLAEQERTDRASAFQGYLTERRDYLEFNVYYDKPDELPEDADEDDIDLYNEKMERYEAYEGIINAVDKWIEKVGRIAA